MRSNWRLLIVGEGSSRKFPGQNLIYLAERDGRRFGCDYRITNGTDALEMLNSASQTIILMSNSGKTREICELAQKLKDAGHPHVFVVTALADTPLNKIVSAEKVHVMACGQEKATAATMSVVEQALILQAIGRMQEFPDEEQRKESADKMTRLLDLNEDVLDARIFDALAKAETIHIMGPHNGVGDELSLKFSETCARAVFYPGTDIVHGYQRTLTDKDAVLVVDPQPQHRTIFEEAVVSRVGRQKILAISDRDTEFATLGIPKTRLCLSGIFQLVAGWRVLLEIAKRTGAEVDNPAGVHKSGNSVEPNPTAA